jgi:hypothetical protein
MYIYIFFYENGDTEHHLGTGFSVYKGILPAVKRVEFISDQVYLCISYV